MQWRERREIWGESKDYRANSMIHDQKRYMDQTIRKQLSFALLSVSTHCGVRNLSGSDQSRFPSAYDANLQASRVTSPPRSLPESPSTNALHASASTATV